MSQRKCYSNIHTKEMKEDIADLEKYIDDTVTSIWADDSQIAYFKKIKELDLSSRRLWLVYTIFNNSIVKTARYFSVDRKTVSTAIATIKSKLDLI